MTASPHVPVLQEGKKFIIITRERDIISQLSRFPRPSTTTGFGSVTKEHGGQRGSEKEVIVENLTKK